MGADVTSFVPQNLKVMDKGFMASETQIPSPDHFLHQKEPERT